MVVEIYTDGGCSPNPGKGGWAYVVVVDGKLKYVDSGFISKATNNSAECYAIKEALRYSLINFDPKDVTIITDSLHLMNSIVEWAPTWAKDDWKRRDGKYIAYKDLFIETYVLYLMCHGIEIKWVKGHSDCYFNNIVDREASLARGASFKNKRTKRLVDHEFRD